MAETKIKCSSCEAVLKLNGPLPQGKTVKCPKCGEPLRLSAKSGVVGKSAPASSRDEEKRRPKPAVRKVEEPDEELEEEPEEQLDEEPDEDLDEAEEAPRKKGSKREESTRPAKRMRRKKGKKQKKGNPVLLWGGIGGGVLVLAIVVIVLVASGTFSKKRTGDTGGGGGSGGSSSGGNVGAPLGFASPDAAMDSYFKAMSIWTCRATSESSQKHQKRWNISMI